MLKENRELIGVLDAMLKNASFLHNRVPLTDPSEEIITELVQEQEYIDTPVLHWHLTDDQKISKQSQFQLIKDKLPSWLADHHMAPEVYIFTGTRGIKRSEQFTMELCQALWQKQNGYLPPSKLCGLNSKRPDNGLRFGRYTLVSDGVIIISMLPLTPVTDYLGRDYDYCYMIDPEEDLYAYQLSFQVEKQKVPIKMMAFSSRDYLYAETPAFFRNKHWQSCIEEFLPPTLLSIVSKDDPVFLIFHHNHPDITGSVLQKWLGAQLFPAAEGGDLQPRKNKRAREYIKRMKFPPGRSQTMSHFLTYTSSDSEEPAPQIVDLHTFRPLKKTRGEANMDFLSPFLPTYGVFRVPAR